MPVDRATPIRVPISNLEFVLSQISSRIFNLEFRISNLEFVLSRI